MTEGDTHLSIRLSPDRLCCAVGDRSIDVPIGVTHLVHSITGDPPDPASLTNAIGLVVDHLDDVERDMPTVRSADRVTVAGHGIPVVAAVEVGAPTSLPVVLTRAAAEDLFRTVATENVADRSLNPGLPAPWVHDIVGTCSVLVAVMRHLGIDAVELHDEHPAGGPGEARQQ